MQNLAVLKHIRFVAFLFLFFSLFSLRVLILRHFEMTWNKAFTQGLMNGIIFDVAFALIPFAISNLFSALSIRFKKITFIVTAVAIYAANLATACYVLFFRKPLDLNLIHYGAGNLWDVRGMLMHFLGYAWIDASLAFLVIAIILHHRGFEIVSQRTRRTWAVSGLALLLVAQLTKQSPIWFHVPQLHESPLSHSILIRWWERWNSRSLQTMSAAEAFSLAHAAPNWFERMRTFDGNTFPPELKQAPRFPYPLAKTDAKKLAAIRSDLGLPKAGPVNVILVFLESNRAYELLNPDFSKAVYPNLKKLLREHGIFFHQTYASADYTVQGQFATLCSTWDRMEGAPVYTNSVYLKIRCLPELMLENGYQTYWMNPYNKDFSGKFIFESNHGMQTFLDGKFFKANTPDEALNSNEWGVSDQVFFSQAFDKIETIAAEKKPFFIHLLNTGTHGPWHRLEGTILPEDLTKILGDHETHIDYLTSVKAEDEALGAFFDRFFKSQMSENTVVVVASDHGNGIVPGGPKLRKYQRTLLWPRTIFGVITKNMKPKVIPYPVSQIDIAPLIANIAGIQGDVTWLGRNPLSGSGTPWVKQTSQLVSYRTNERICIETSKGSARCWRVDKNEDPLLLSNLEEEENDLSLANELKAVIQANEAWIDAGGI